MATAQVLYAMVGCIDYVAQAYVRQNEFELLLQNPWLDEGFGTARAGIHEAECQVFAGSCYAGRLTSGRSSATVLG